MSNKVPYRVITPKKQLPYALYSVEQVYAMENLAKDKYGLSEAELMERAGEAAFNLANKYWKNLQQVIIFCGSGNNAGDGFVLARLFKAYHIEVQLVLMSPIKPEKKQTYAYFQECCQRKIPFCFFNDFQLPQKPVDLIIDALLGIGLSKPIREDYAKAVHCINQQTAPVLSIDVPSGLDADTGNVLSVAVKANATITYIGLKKGLFTSNGSEYCGKMSYHALQLPARVFASQIHQVRRMDWTRVMGSLIPRHRNSHKGNFGHLLIIGGTTGMLGATLLTAKAAFRCGAGKITIATVPKNAEALALCLPEVMTFSINQPAEIIPLLKNSNVVVIGPGLGTEPWALALLKLVIAENKPMVIDADALRLLPQCDTLPSRALLTPHPGEAAFLLETKNQIVQENRFEALQKLHQKFTNTIILKGAGSLIATQDNQPPALCVGGNPGMAVAGMGDVLSGILGALLAQHMDINLAAIFGTCLHAEAGDRASKNGGERGMMASDLMDWIRTLNNEG